MHSNGSLSQPLQGTLELNWARVARARSVIAYAEPGKGADLDKAAFSAACRRTDSQRRLPTTTPSFKGGSGWCISGSVVICDHKEKKKKQSVLFYETFSSFVFLES